MRRVLWAIALVACGGQLAIEPDDAGVDAAKDGGVKDAIAPVDVVGIDDIAVQPTCGVSTQSLLAYYPLDQDTGDHTGHGFDALGANLAPATGIVGGAMHFDGATSSIRVTSGGNAYLKGPRTLCAWSLVMSPPPGLGEPLFWAGTSGTGDFFSVSAVVPSGGTCQTAAPNTPFIDHWGNPCVVPTTPPAMPAKWNLVCYAYDGARVMFFVDGFPAPPVPTLLYDYPMMTLFLGSTLGTGTTTNASLAGDLDEVTVWTTALSPNEMQALWNNGAGCAASSK